MESTLVNKVIFGEYYIGNVMYILLRVYSNIAEPPYLRYEGRGRSTSNKSHGVSSQESTRLTQTAVDTARIYKCKGHSITILNPQSSFKRRFKFHLPFANTGSSSPYSPH